MKEIFDQFSAFWKKLGPNQKASILLAIVIGASALAGIVYYANRPQYEFLFGGLAPEDSAKVINYLGSNNIPYQAPGNGSTVLVPRDRAAEVRAAIIERSLVKGGVEGFELLDKSNLGLTDSLLKMNLTRAIQGEISKTLNKMSWVEDSKVMISPDEKSLFIKDEKPAKASVYLTLRPGKIATPDAISSVTYFVAGAFPGLKPENVFVMDHNGRPLHTPQEKTMEANSSQLASNKLTYQKMEEEHRRVYAQDMLDKAYGSGKTIVGVSVAVKNPPPIIEKVEYDKKAPLKSEKKIDRDTQSGTPTGSGGATGIAERTANAGNATTGGTSSTSDSSKESYKEYSEPGKTITRNMATGFDVEKLSVSLMIDKALEAQKAAIEEQVKRAVGWSQQRGDEVIVAAVVEMPKAEAAPVEEGGMLDNWNLVEIIKYSVQGLVAIIGLFFLKGLIKKGGKGKAAAGGVPGGPEGVTVPPEVLARIQSRRSTELLAATDQAGAGRVAKSWMTAKK